MSLMRGWRQENPPMPASHIDPIQKDPVLRLALLLWSGGPGRFVMDGLQEVAYLIDNPKKRISYRAARNLFDFKKSAKSGSNQLSLDLAMDALQSNIMNDAQSSETSNISREMLENLAQGTTDQAE